MSELTKEDVPAIPKTIEGLRDVLFDEIKQLREGTSNPTRARVIAQMAGQVIDSLRVQIQYGRLIKEGNDKPLQLGSRASAAGVSPS